MRAARFHGAQDIRIEDIPEPVLRPGTVKIKVEWCGICGTDLHEFTDGPIFCPDPQEPHPLTGEVSPVVLGHEFAGVVAAVGEGVTGFETGDRVTVEPRIVCGECAPCSAGHSNSCQSAATIGLAGGGGGLAEFIVVDSKLVFPLGELSTECGALVEPLAVAYHAVRQSGMAAGQSALVVGAGPIGLLVAAVLKAQGCSTLVVVERSATRRDRAAELGADIILDPAQEDAQSIIEQATGGAGFDVAFECAGADPALALCFDSIRASGTVVNVAIRKRPATVDLLPLVLKEIRFIGSICYANDHAPVIELLKSGSIPVERLITKRIGLDQLLEEGFQSLLHDQESQVKILVRP